MLKPPAKNIFGKVREKFNFLNRIGLENREFTIISDNCWGGLVYKHFAMEYRSPFANLFLFPPCYLRLLQNFEESMNQELRFIEPSASKYAEIMRQRKSLDTYPVGVLIESIELHFLHYREEEDIRFKWDKRKERINFLNIMFKFSDRDNPSPELIRQFDELPFKNKVCFSEKPYPYKSVVKMADFQLKEFLNNLQR